jgi:hypothetical protein
MMSGLMVITAVMVLITMTAAIITARELETLKTRLAKLEGLREETYKRLGEVKGYRQSLKGTREMLNNVFKTRMDQRKTLLAELERLKEEVVEERIISVSKPLQAPEEEF